MTDTKTTLPVLTPRQNQVYQFLKDKIQNRGYGPTVREMMRAFGMKSPSGITCHLKALEKKGYITREYAKSRAIQLREKQLAGSRLPVVGTIAAGQPVLATESLEPAEFASVFARGNVAFRVADETLAGDSIARGDFVVRNESGQDVAVIRRM